MPEAKPVSVDGIRLVCEGEEWIYQGLTGFRLLEFLAHGREGEAEAYLDWAQQTNFVNTVRVLTAAKWLFTLSPDEGRAELPRLLDMAFNRGLYLEVVGAVDTAEWSPDQIRDHLAQVDALIAPYPNRFLEGANEPDHPTQHPEVGDIVRAFQPQTHPYAMGAIHGGTAIPVQAPRWTDQVTGEHLRYAGGDYITVHTYRATDPWTPSGGASATDDDDWYTRRIISLIRYVAEKPTIDDECKGAAETTIPGKRIADPLWWTLRGQRMAEDGGGTFHYQDGLQGIPPTGQQLVCFEAWVRGMKSGKGGEW